MEIIKIPDINELKEFADKYSFAVKELKNSIIELVKFDKFIISNEWNSMNDSERFIFLETLYNLKTAGNILQNNVISIVENEKYSRWNYGDYESLYQDYLHRKPIDITKFAKEYPLIIDKIKK